MRRRRFILLASFLMLALSLMVSSVLLGIVVHGGPTRVRGPVYALAQVEAGLLHHPQAWLGRAVLVRALLQYEPCPYRVANGNSGRTFVDRYECYLVPAWVAERMREHTRFTLPPPFRLAAKPPVTPAFVLHNLPLIGRFIPLPRLDEIDGPLDTTAHIYRILLVPPRECTPATTGGLTPCPQGQFIGRVS